MINFAVCTTISFLRPILFYIYICYIFLDFSLTKFLEEQKEDLSDQLSSAVTQTLLSRLGLPEFLLDSPCDRTKQPFTNGWKNGEYELE